MESITKVWTGPLPADSPYVKPYRFYFLQDGVEKNWDLLKVHDSVSIIIYNTTRKVLVFVRQFRPAVYISIVSSSGGDLNNVDLKKFPPHLGVTIELCSGIVDKNKTWPEIAQEEVLEECGYNVPVEKFEEVLSHRTGVGHSGGKQNMYYCEVTDSQRVNIGGGVEDEKIEVVDYTLDEAKELLAQGSYSNCPPGFLLGVMWFFMNKAPKS